MNSTQGDFVMNPQGCLYGFFHNASRFSDQSLKNMSIAVGSLKTLSRNCFVPGKNFARLLKKVF